MSPRSRSRTPPPPAPKPTVFIGSSREAQDRGIVHAIVDGLADRFLLLPWDGVFTEESESTLQTLLRLATEVDAAILVCAHDDTTNKRGSVSPVARDNINIEYGIFLAALGARQVSVLWEAGVNAPTDVSGLNRRIFKSDGKRSRIVDDPLLRHSLVHEVQGIAERWKELQPRPAPRSRAFADGGIALADTLAHADGRIVEIARELNSFAATGTAESKMPIRFDSHRLCLRAYEEGLRAVQRRFWTTSFLDSEFWANRKIDVLDANKAMLGRIIPKGGSVRRLFLLDDTPQREIDRLKRRMLHLRQANAADDVRRMQSSLRTLADNFKRLGDARCEVKVAHDHTSHADKLPSNHDHDIQWRNSEVALYDEFRLDVFGGRPRGAINNLLVFSGAYRGFEALREEVEGYFEALWKDGQPGDDFIDGLERAYDEAEKRIDYNSNWLAVFEYYLEREDKDLKVAELKRVEEVLGDLDRQGKVRRYLDIGSCTGRYPRQLREHVRADGQILGVDVDEDCIQFCRNHPDLVANPDPRISFELMDFTSSELGGLGRFDLVTCMMSTLSHFGVNRNTRFEDALQVSLNRVRTLMEPDSLFVFSVYSEQARSRLNLLKIYQKQEMERLAAGTPDPAEMHRRLDAAGLRVIKEARPDLRLDMYVCQPAN